MARKKHGPGMWLCWACVDIVTNDPGWDDKMWIWSGKSKGGPCHRCKKMVRAGDKAAKVTMDAPI